MIHSHEQRCGNCRYWQLNGPYRVGHKGQGYECDAPAPYCVTDRRAMGCNDGQGCPYWQPPRAEA
jgi:hypothetical protein